MYLKMVKLFLVLMVLVGIVEVILSYNGVTIPTFLAVPYWLLLGLWLTGVLFEGLLLRFIFTNNLSEGAISGGMTLALILAVVVWVVGLAALFLFLNSWVVMNIHIAVFAATITSCAMLAAAIFETEKLFRS